MNFLKCDLIDIYINEINNEKKINGLEKNNWISTVSAFILSCIFMLTGLYLGAVIVFFIF